MMLSSRYQRCSFWAISLVLLSGCGQKLDYETSLDLDEGQVQSISVDAPKREQKVSVTATSSSSPIDIYVVLDKDKEAGKQALLDRRKVAAALASQTKTRNPTLEVTVPANTGIAILVGGAGKSSHVTVKVSGH
ncbi:MAG TPA: hypothetical protein VKU02_13885 [Gemmataceae bacterium]|nr:hypothetical protein [Gemmataceae bacterium]